MNGGRGLSDKAERYLSDGVAAVLPGRGRAGACGAALVNRRSVRRD